MRTSIAAAAIALASVATAQLPNVPSCSLNCFVTALSSDGCSGLTDFACHCQKTSLIGDITPCVQQACSTSDQAAVISAVQSECASVGHPLSLSGAASSAASSAMSSGMSMSMSGSSSAVVTSVATTTQTSLVGTGTIITATNGTVVSTAQPTVTSEGASGSGTASGTGGSTGAAAHVTQAAGYVAAALAFAAAL